MEVFESKTLVGSDEYSRILEENHRMKKVIDELMKFRKTNGANFANKRVGFHYDLCEVFEIQKMVMSDDCLKEIFK